jgi:hypothetical protein
MPHTRDILAGENRDLTFSAARNIIKIVGDNSHGKIKEGHEWIYWTYYWEADTKRRKLRRLSTS